MSSALLLPVLSFAAIQQAATGEAFAPNSPLGRVVDVQKAAVRVSLGSKHGAKVGMRLTVYRLEPAPRYLGELQLAAVNDDHSWAMLVSYVNPYASPRQLVQVNDFVRASAPRPADPPKVLYVRPPGAYERGGAIIDLSAPKPGR